MQHKWLRSFHWVANSGSIAAAAEALHIAPSALSKQIKDLEQSYNIRLFERSANSLTLTSIGSSLKAETERLFSAEKSVQDLLRKTKNRKQSVLNIGLENLGIILPLIGELHHKSAMGLFRFYEYSHSVLRTMLLQNKIDLLISHDLKDEIPSDFYQKLLSYRIGRNELQFIQSAVNPILPKQEEPIPLLLLLKHYPLIVRTSDSLTRQIFDRLCHDLGVTPTIIAELSSRDSLLQTIGHLPGIGVVLERPHVIPHPQVIPIDYQIPQGLGEYLGQNIFIFGFSDMRHNPLLKTLVANLATT